MKAELKQKWLEALRSGRYRQGKNVLRTSQDEFCCLGVLCDIVSPNGWLVDAGQGGGFLHGDRKGFLSMAVKLATAFPELYEVTLSNMNDDGKSFAEIANWIEVNIPAEGTQP